MYSIPLLTAAFCLVFLYRTQNVASVAFRSGLQHVPLEELKRNPIMRLAARIRLALGLAIMIMVTIVGYRVPVEIGQVISSAQDRQVRLQNERLRYRLEAERSHVVSMIDLMGSSENYLRYVNRAKNAN